MKYKKYKLDNFNVYTIRTDRFKKCRIEIIFNEDIKEEDIMKSCFLNRMLSSTTGTYKTKLALSIRLEELYDSYFSGGTTKLGNTLVSTFSTEFLNPKYCDKGFLNEMLDFLFDVLNNPNVSNKEFDKETFKTVRNVMESKIVSRREDPQNIAIDETIEIMTNDPIIKYVFPGTLKDLKKVTPKNLYEHYQKTFQKINCDILIIGDLDMDEVVKEIQKRYIFKGDKNYQIKYPVPMEEVKKEKVARKKAKYNQSILVLGYNCNNLNFKEKQIIAPVISRLLSSGASGKLYKYLREEHSLCYYVYPDARAENDVLFIFAGIDAKNYDKALKLIKKAIDDIKKGNITKDELSNAKQGLITFLDTINDRQNNLIDDYYMTEIGFYPSLKERRKGVDKVTIKDIIKVAKHLKINTTFLLEGELKNEKN